MTDLLAFVELLKPYGLRINNLFQLRDGRWQANLIGIDDTGHEFGIAADPHTALREAFDRAKLKMGKLPDGHDLV